VQKMCQNAPFTEGILLDFLWVGRSPYPYPTPLGKWTPLTARSVWEVWKNK